MNNGFSWRTEFDICDSTVSKNSYLFYRQQKTFEPCSSIYQHCYFASKCVEYANKRETLPSPCLDSYNCHPIAFKLLPNGLVMKQYRSLVQNFVSTATWCQPNLLNYSLVSCSCFFPSQEIFCTKPSNFICVVFPSGFPIFRNFLPNHGRILPALTYNGLQPLNANAGRILPGFGRKLWNIGKLAYVSKI